MADCHGFSRGQTPGSAVGFVVVFCRSREDQLPGFFTDLGKAVKRATHCGLGHAELLR